MVFIKSLPFTEVSKINVFRLYENFRQIFVKMFGNGQRDLGGLDD